MALEEDVLGLLAQSDVPLDDDQIARRLGANRQYVNAVCRRLASSGRLVRKRGPGGKLVNFLGGTHPPTEDFSLPTTTRGRVDSQARVEDLIAHFTECVERFEVSNAFPGPSLYFHERAIERRRQHSSVGSLLQDKLFFEYVYAMLPAWGMHRMGKQAAKVGDFDLMVDSFRGQEALIEEIFDRRLDELRREEVEAVANSAWKIIAGLKVSLSGTRIVAGSKALHHMLPDLVPPVDRQYTWRFFTGQTTYLPRGGEEAAFRKWFPLFADIASRRRESIKATLSRGGFMATGIAKVVDNAIMGFMLALDGMEVLSEET